MQKHLRNRIVTTITHTLSCNGQVCYEDETATPKRKLRYNNNNNEPPFSHNTRLMDRLLVIRLAGWQFDNNGSANALPRFIVQSLFTIPIHRQHGRRNGVGVNWRVSSQAVAIFMVIVLLLSPPRLLQQPK